MPTNDTMNCHKACVETSTSSVESLKRDDTKPQRITKKNTL